MKVALINGSPKAQDSISEFLLNQLETKLRGEIIHYSIIKEYRDDTEIFDKLLHCDCIVFAFPVYVDGIPAHGLQFLVDFCDYIKSSGENSNTAVYVISNNGFYEGIRNKISVDIMKNWCKRAGLTWGQGVGTGAGEMLGVLRSVPLGYGPNANLGKLMKEFSKNIMGKNTAPDRYVSPNFPKFGFHFCAMCLWIYKAGKNKCSKFKIFKRVNS
jgi:multimeric flavodoxin WrbA